MTASFHINFDAPTYGDLKAEIEQLKADVLFWQEENENHRIRCIKFIAAAVQLLQCEEQRQERSNAHFARYGERVSIPPQFILYLQCVLAVNEALAGIGPAVEEYHESCDTRSARP